MRRPSPQQEFKMVPCPGPSSEAAPFFHVHFRGQTRVPEWLGAWCPIPTLSPGLLHLWLCRMVCMRALPCCLLPLSPSSPSAHRHYWLSDCPYPLLPTSLQGLCTRGGLWNPGLGFYNRTSRGRASSTKGGRHTTLPLYQLGQFSIKLNCTLRGFPLPRQRL